MLLTIEYLDEPDHNCVSWIRCINSEDDLQFADGRVSGVQFRRTPDMADRLRSGPPFRHGDEVEVKSGGKWHLGLASVDSNGATSFAGSSDPDPYVRRVEDTIRVGEVVLGVESWQDDWVRVKSGHLPVKINDRECLQIGMRRMRLEIFVEIDEHASIRNLKESICHQLHIDPDRQLVSYLHEQDNAWVATHLETESIGPRSTGHKAVLKDFNLPDGCTLHLVDFSPLRPSHMGRVCHQSNPAERGITLNQVEKLMEFMRNQCNQDGSIFVWTDSANDRPVWYDTINLHLVMEWAIIPCTLADKCSYAEFTAPRFPEKPVWFVSYWWGDAIIKLVLCLREHARLRQLQDAGYWICAFSNNQYELGHAQVRDPNATPFVQAMSICSGVLLMLGEDAVPFTRAWCCFEQSIVVSSSDQENRMKSGNHELLLDLAVVVGFEAHICTDGPTGEEADLKTSILAKLDRDRRFPVHVLKTGLQIDIEAAQATFEADKVRILNTIAGINSEAAHASFESDRARSLAGVPGGRDQRVVAPPKGHRAYTALNAELSTLFALIGWQMAVERDEQQLIDMMCVALRNDVDRKSLQICFKQCLKFDDASLAELITNLPPKLHTLDIDLEGTSVGNLAAQALTACLPSSILNLRLDFTSCRNIGDVAIAMLAQGLPPLLQELMLQLKECGSATPNSVTDVGVRTLGAGLPRTLRQLVLTFYGNRQFTDNGFEALVMSLPNELESLYFDLAWTSVGDEGVLKLVRHLPECIQDVTLLVEGPWSETKQLYAKLPWVVDFEAYPDPVDIDCVGAMKAWQSELIEEEHRRAERELMEDLVEQEPVPSEPAEAPTPYPPVMLEENKNKKRPRGINFCLCGRSRRK